MTATDKATVLLAERRVHILHVDGQNVAARVRGNGGIHDVSWSRLTGWSCTYPAYGRCSHEMAVDAVTMRPVGGRRRYTEDLPQDGPAGRKQRSR